MATSVLRYADDPVLQSVVAYGSETLVPNHDICRLSYYLKCCTVGCGVDMFLNMQLIDYQNAHRLPFEYQEAIVRLVFNDLCLDTLINRFFIIDDQHILIPRGTLNTFYEFKTASAFFSIDRFAVLSGRQIQIHRVMLCTLKWLKEYYIDPFLRYQQGRPIVEIRAVRVLDQDIINRIHPSTIRCIPGEGERSGQPELAMVPVSAVEGQDLAHRNIWCGSCSRRDIRGSRYKCLQCIGFDLCELCYSAGRHDQTHEFERLSYAGAEPEPMGARVETIPTDGSCALVPDIPMAIAIALDDRSCENCSIVHAVASLVQ
jgi:hypothetical protein